MMRVTDPQQDSSEVDERFVRLRSIKTERSPDTDELIADLLDEVERQDLAYRYLEGAIASSRRIGTAVGIIMACTKATEDEAFGVLAKLSRRRNRTIRSVANDIVDHGAF